MTWYDCPIPRPVSSKHNQAIRSINVQKAFVSHNTGVNFSYNKRRVCDLTTRHRGQQGNFVIIMQSTGAIDVLLVDRQRHFTYSIFQVRVFLQKY
mmetsp:Transcript_17829/g.29804  ORF Transcript_17829/g.29804 Transcript_17829/m.29804 type:complete len:95 (-) Transcript_17829:160-444(-)